MRVWSAVLAVATLASAANGQCDVWLPTPGDSNWIYASPNSYNVSRLRAVDHDGPGPLPSTLYGAYPLSRWNGLAWEVLPVISSSDPIVYGLEALNESAGGLPPGRLLLGGQFISADGSCRVVASWDGQTLSGIGPSSAADFSASASIGAFTAWDPDGPGPTPPWLIAAGSFTRIGGVTTSNIAAWDGTQWRALGAGLTQPVGTLVSYDPDGPGPSLPLLIAGGAGGTIKSWNGTAWQTMGAGFIGTTTVNGLAVFDPDGDGPMPVSLWVGGSFTASGATQLPGLAQWSGTAWVSPGAAYPGGGTVNVIRVLDLDGPGPQLPRLVVGGVFGQTPLPQYTRTVATFDGAVWTPLNGSPNGGNVNVASLEVFDPDSSGPRGPELLVTSSTSTQIGWPVALQYRNLGAWDGQRWMTLGGEFHGAVKWFEWLDETGDGVTPPALYAVGEFSAVNGGLADSIARWDGTKWVGIGTPHGHLLRQVLTHDPDGPGPQAPWIIAVESGSQGPGVLRLQNGAWTTIGSPPFNGWSAASYDDDAGGPLQPRLLATFGGSLYRYNGLSWTSADTVSGYMWLFRHLDPGTPSPSLYGLFSTSILKRWNGVTWNTVTSRSSNNNLAIARAVSWDPDGDGPRPAEVVVGSSQVGASAFAEAYDAQSWRRVALAGGQGRSEIVWTPSTFDPDGPGPAAPQLVLGIGYGSPSLFARLANDQWVQPSPGIQNRGIIDFDPTRYFVQAFATVDPDGDGPLPPELWIGGNFTHANGTPAANWTRWRLATATPVFTQQPTDTTACLNSAATFNVVASDATTYSWRTASPPSGPGWIILSDGPLVVAGQQVATITGAATPSLHVQPSGAPFTATFRCAAGNPCASIETASAQLTVAPCCGSPDFNHDGDSATDQDIEAFFACLAGNCCPTCDSADFNGDGDAGTDADIESFFRVLAGGTC